MYCVKEKWEMRRQRFSQEREALNDKVGYLDLIWSLWGASDGNQKQGSIKKMTVEAGMGGYPEQGEAG